MLNKTTRSHLVNKALRSTAQRLLHDVWGYELPQVSKNISISNCLGYRALSIVCTVKRKRHFCVIQKPLSPTLVNMNKWDRQQKQSELDYNLDQIFYHLSFLKNQNMDTKWYKARSSFYFCFFSVFLTFLVVFFWSFLISCLMILFLCKKEQKKKPINQMENTTVQKYYSLTAVLSFQILPFPVINLS